MEEIQNETILDATVTEKAGASEQSIDDTDLKSKVRKQVEYYFSKENLQQDAYLMSQMDSNMSVPISVIMQFQKLKLLTQDESLVVAALDNSSVSIVDGRIKSNVKSGGRSTIILREIPTDCGEEEVREIFAFDGCKPILSMRSDIGDTWFVMMESEEDAKDTLVDLKIKKRMFRGQPVKGRMKSETIVRSFYPMQPAPPPMMYTGIPFPPYGPPMPIDMRVFGYGIMPMPNGMMPHSLQNGVTMGQSMVAEQVDSDGKMSATTAGDASESTSEHEGHGSASDVKSNSTQRSDRRNATGNSQGVKASPQREVRERKASSGNSGTGGTTQSRDRQRDSGGQGDRKGASGRGGKGRDAPAKASPVPNPVEISAANFPPLQLQEADTPIPTPGYKGEFRKYSADDIILIVKDIKDAVLPESIKPAEHVLAMTTTPNLDLLKRQRTFSIDETREQLRQGRPVQREAISAGAVDYKSMIFGDGYLADAGVATTGLKPTAAAVVVNNLVCDVPSPTTSLPVTNESTVVAAATSPRKITASSWAAMVMSSTPPQLDGAGGSMLNPKPAAAKPEKAIGGKDNAKAKVGTKAESGLTGATKKAGAAAVNGNNAHASDKKRVVVGDLNLKKEGKLSGKDAIATKSGKVEEVVAEGEKVSAPGSKENDAPVVDSAVTKAAEKALVPSWGGKATFASILKQQAEVTTPAAVLPVSPAQSPKSSGNTGSSSLKNGAGTPTSPQRKDVNKAKKADAPAKGAECADTEKPTDGAPSESAVAPVAAIVH